MGRQLTWYIDSDHILTIPDVQDADGNAQTDADVDVTVLDFEDNEVSGATWPIAASHTSGGDYEAALPDTISNEPNKRYVAKVEITLSSGAKRTVYATLLSVKDDN